MKIIVATKNQGKMKEIKMILSDCEMVSMGEAGINLDVEEDGASFEENAVKKAMAIYRETGISALADDSGLVVDALGGRPGIYSARYGGPGLTDADRTNLLLEEMKNVPEKERTARFVCAMALVVSPEEIYVTRGECEGEIAFSPHGENGFGYDPVFFVPDFHKTFSQMSADEKNQISHRKRALEAMAQKIKEC